MSPDSADLVHCILMRVAIVNWADGVGGADYVGP
jgi:hypothetical protein